MGQPWGIQVIVSHQLSQLKEADWWGGKSGSFWNQAGLLRIPSLPLASWEMLGSLVYFPRSFVSLTLKWPHFLHRGRWKSQRPCFVSLIFFFFLRNLQTSQRKKICKWKVNISKRSTVQNKIKQREEGEKKEKKNTERSAELPKY